MRQGTSALGQYVLGQLLALGVWLATVLAIWMLPALGYGVFVVTFVCAIFSMVASYALNLKFSLMATSAILMLNILLWIAELVFLERAM